MTNPHKGEVPFTVEGKQYVMRFSINSLCELEEVTGKGIVAILDELQTMKKVSLTLTRQIIWAGLREKHPDTTLQEAGDLIMQMGGLQVVLPLLDKAFTTAFPKPAEENTEEARPPKASLNGTGQSSTNNGPASEETTRLSGSEPQERLD